MVPMLGNDACRWFECFNVMFRGCLSHYYYYSAFEDGTLPMLLLLDLIGSTGINIMMVWHHHFLARIDTIRDERARGLSRCERDMLSDLARFSTKCCIGLSQCGGCTPRNGALTRSDDGQIERYGLPVRRPNVARRSCFGGRQRSNMATMAILSHAADECKEDSIMRKISAQWCRGININNYQSQLCCHCKDHPVKDALSLVNRDVVVYLRFLRNTVVRVISI